MAVVRARTSPPYALIIFVILWVISTGVAVFLFTRQSKINQDADTARAELQKYVLPHERADGLKLIEYGNKGKAATVGEGRTPSAAESKVTAVAEATRQIKALKDVLVGDAAPATDTLVKDLRLELGGASSIAAALRTERERVKQLLQQADAAKSDLKAANELNKSQRDEYVDARDKDDKVIKSREAELKTRTGELADANAKIQALVDEREKLKTDQAATIDKMVRDFNVKLAQAESENASLRNTIANLRLVIESLRPRTGSKIPAVANGNIIRTDSVAGDVYINLGRADRVIPGLSFAVYSAATGVITDGAGSKGKATIEVVEVGERESRCRITHLEKAQTIQNNDLLFNVVWTNDKTRKLHFVVYGDFDIDGDGEATALEREKLVRMIKDWGGIIDDIKYVEETKGDKTDKLASLDPLTDYLVLGTPPRVPAGYKLEDLDETTKGIVTAQMAKSKEYDRIESEAKRSSVPILNANRFLNLIGYYNTTLIRR